MLFFKSPASGPIVRRMKYGLAASLIALGAGNTPGNAWAETTLTAVMHSDLRVLDPIITTAHITRDHAYMIYDVLIAVDENFKPQPQMADWTISDDQKVYTLTLRDGLKFHDGTPVTATDAVASLQRWAKRDAGGQLIMDISESLKVADDKTLVWTLREPFAPFLDTLSKQAALPLSSCPPALQRPLRTLPSPNISVRARSSSSLRSSSRASVSATSRTRIMFREKSLRAGWLGARS